MFQASANIRVSASAMAIEYGSSPVAHPALQMRILRGFSQNFFTCISGRTLFSSASYTAG